MRGDIHQLKPPRGTRGSEQQGNRFAVVLQADELMLSTVLIAPTSRSAPPRIFRPTISVADEATQVLLEQTTAVSPARLGPLVGHIARQELVDINEALRLVLGLD